MHVFSQFLRKTLDYKGQHSWKEEDDQVLLEDSKNNCRLFFDKALKVGSLLMYDRGCLRVLSTR